MRFGTSVATCFRKYADPSGRASRSEFWFFYGFAVSLQLIVALPLMLLGVVLASWLVAAAEAGIDPGLGLRWYGDLLWIAAVLTVVTLVLGVVLGIPLYCAQARRLHDMGQDGRWVLLTFIGAGSIPLVMAAVEGDPEPNRWGDAPDS